MDLELSREQDELRRSARELLDKECPPAVARAMAEKGEQPDRLWATFVELGWPALGIPESCGGLGLGTVELAVVLEELGRHLAPGPFVATATTYVPLLLACPATPERDALLAAAAEGGTGTVAIAESPDQWPSPPLATTAQSSRGQWLLDGRKEQVLDGATAERVAVVAQVSDGSQVVAVVEAGAAVVHDVAAVDGTRPFAALDFRGVAVAPERVFPVDAHGLCRAFDVAALAVAVECVGVCQAVLDIVLDHVKNRHQFGVPIGSFQAVKHKAADMFVVLERARATAYAAALAVDESDERDRSLAVSMAKSAAGDAQLLIAQDGIQLMGGIGYTWEHDMHLFAKRAKSGAAAFGSPRWHRARIAGLIGL